MTVSLVTLPKPNVAPTTASARPAALDILTARLKTEAAPVFAPPTDDHAPDRLNALADRIADSRRPSPPTVTAPPTAPVPTPPAPRAAAGALRSGPTAEGVAEASAATGGLWGQIEPCWRNSGARVAVPVSLEVTLDTEGRLAKPPLILRSGSSTDETRLTAEATALQVLGRCLPRGDLRFGGRAYRLDFLSR